MQERLTYRIARTDHADSALPRLRVGAST
jgi:hypothetical protein